MAALQVGDADARRCAFGAAQAAATVMAAIAWNFALNNMLTYRDQRLAGWRFLTGLMRFQLICAVGAISNVGRRKPGSTTTTQAGGWRASAAR